MSAHPLLDLTEVSLAFEGLKALDKVTFGVMPNRIIGLIGPNGAGKTTLLNCLTRIYAPDSGSVKYDGIDLLATPAHKIISIGIARTFQNLELAGTQSVIDNVVIGALSRSPIPFLPDMLGLPSARRKMDLARERSLAALNLLEIGETADLQVKTLPYGIQKRVELARALVTQPRLLLLDEPAAGLNPDETFAVARLLKSLRHTQGLTILLIEHDMQLVMSVCDEIVVLNHGEVVAHGSPAAVRTDPKVIEAYLGVEAIDAA